MTSRALANLALIAVSCGAPPPMPAPIHQPEAPAADDSRPACSAVALGKLPRHHHPPVTLLYLSEPSAALLFEAGFIVDADGSPNAYRSDDKGLDYLANACSKNGRCWGILQREDGTRVRQDRPRRRYFVTPTSLQDSSKPHTDQSAYVNAETTAYVALPLSTLKRLGRTSRRSFPLRLGDVAFIRNKKNGRSTFAIFADLSPSRTIGEGSIALADALGIPSSPRYGGAKSGIEFLIFLGSGDGQTHTQSEIDRMASDRLGSWGGTVGIDTCLAEASEAGQRR